MLGSGVRDAIVLIARLIRAGTCRTVIINVQSVGFLFQVMKKIINRKMKLESEKITESPFLSSK